MEGKSDYDNLLWLMSSNFGGNINDDSHGPGDDPNQYFAMAAGKDWNQSNALSLPQWHCQKAPYNYVDILAESSTFLERANGADMLQTITSPIGGGQSVYGVSEIQKALLFNKLGSPCGYKPADPSLDMDASKVRFRDPHNEVESANNFISFQAEILSQNHTSGRQEPYGDNCNVSQLHPRVKISPPFILSKQSSKVGFHNPHNEVESANNFMSFQAQILSQNHTSGREEPYEDNCNVSQCHPRVKVSPSFILSKPCSSASRQRTIASDRFRRLRIAERVRALQELLPHSVEGNQAAVMDDIVDYIKFLQLQVKELSRSRLGGQPASAPFVFLEGYGHYVLNEQTTNEPLEEMLGKLLKTNPSAASQLLESRGLYMMPISLAEG